MGVKGLTTIISSMNLGSQFVFKDCQIIIDCNALVHYIYSTNDLDHFYGGQSHQIYLLIYEFMNNLKENNVNAIVVTDGHFNPEFKEKTKLLRMNQLLNTTVGEHPDVKFSLEFYYNKIVFEICDQLQFKHVTEKDEADRSIALLAHCLNAPVLSNDSDFYIYNTRSGYISLSTLRKPTTDCPMTGTIVSATDVARALNIEVRNLPLLATLAGNDFINYLSFYENFRGFYQKYPGGRVINKLSRFIQSCRSDKEAIEKFLSNIPHSSSSEFYPLALKVCAAYDIQSTIDGEEPEAVVKRLLTWIHNNCTLKPYYSYLSINEQKAFIDFNLHLGSISPQIALSADFGLIYLTIPAQDLSKPSVHDISMNIRKAIYKLVALPSCPNKSIIEFDRILKKYDRKNSVIIENLTENERSVVTKNSLEFILSVLGMSFLPPGMLIVFENNRFNIDWTFFACVTNFIVKSCKKVIPKHILQIFLLSILQNIFSCTVNDRFVTDNIPVQLPKGSLQLLEFAGQYCSVITYLDGLNTLLNFPINTFPPKFWYDGCIIVSFYIKSSADNCFVANTLSTIGIESTNFEKLYSICFNN